MWFSINPSALPSIESPLQSRLNWKKADWELFTKTLQSEHLKMKTVWDSLMAGADYTQNLDTASKLLTDLIDYAASCSTPPINISPRSKIWWSDDIRKARTNMATHLRQWRFSETPDSFAAYKEARNAYFHAIRKAKSDKWIEFLEGVKGKDVFQVLRYTRPRRNEPTPALSHQGQTATTFEQKCSAFRQAMFPSPPVILPSPPAPPQTILPWKTLTRNEIETAIFSSNPNKAPGPDGIPFSCLRHAFNALPDAFVSLYSSLTKRGYHPEIWRTSTTAIIPKPNKPAYNIPKAYRPVALLNCMGKVLEKIMATRLSWLVEKHQLLYRDQVGGRPQRSAVDAVMALVHHVESANRQNLVASALFMDVKGAFDHVSSRRLQVTMTELGLPTPLIAWVQSFLTDRQTSLAFDGRKEEMLPVETGIPQGSPISPILFLLYLQPLFSHLEAHHPGFFYPSYIDDVGIVVTGRSEAENARTLQQIASTIIAWSDDNALSFDGPKTELIHFKKRIRPPIQPLSVTVDNTTIQPSTCIRWLGVWLDPTLSFKEHIRQKTTSATRAYFALRRLANTQNGLTVSSMRLLYLSAVLPILDFGAEIWYTGERQQGYVSQLQKVQNKALRSLLGAFRTSPTAALEAESAIPPTRTRLQHLRRKYAIRIATLPPSHTLRRLVPETFPPHDSGRSTLDEYGELRPWHTINTSLRFHSRLDHTLHQVSKWLGPSDPLETYTTSLNPPWYSSPPIDFALPTGTKEEAAVAHTLQLQTIMLKSRQWIAYSDGSRLDDGRVGAGIHYIDQDLQHPAPDEAAYLGRQQEVYDAELYGATQAIQTLTPLALTTRGRPPRDIWVFLDNAAAIQRLQHLGPGPGQRFSALVHRLARQLTQNNIKLHIHWVPGHLNVTGNEKADALAKEGATLNTINSTTYSLTWLKRHAKAEVFLDWMDEWDHSTHGRGYEGAPRRQLDPVYKSAARLLTSQILQLRTGHGYFRTYLHRIRPERFASPLCHCGQDRQSPAHLLIHCSAFQRQRQALRKEMGTTPVTSQTLLYTHKGVEKLVPFLQATRVATRRWMLGEEEDETEDRAWRGDGAGWGDLREEDEGSGDV